MTAVGRVDAGTALVDDQRSHDQTLDGELLHAEGLSKSYGHVRALSGVDISIHRGETVAVLGHNGSGKSTLLRILSGRDEARHWIDDDRR